jgi:hypothetical protein
MSLAKTVDRILRAQLAAKPELDNADLESTLRVLAKWRHQLIGNTIRARHGRKVAGGPFAGLVVAPEVTEGGQATRLLGCYEPALHPHLERLIARGFPRVVNIGCADGYYAIGLARRMPGSIVHAHDIDPRARHACAETAAENGVADRVRVGGEVTPALLQDLAGRGCWVVCDIEGGEDALIDPAAVPALHDTTLLVECHEGERPGVTDRLAARFAPTHGVIRVEARITEVALPDWLANGSHLDQLIALWEWRQAATPWLVLEPR